jgi:hypothetical protein
VRRWRGSCEIGRGEAVEMMEWRTKDFSGFQSLVGFDNIPLHQQERESESLIEDG